MARAAAALAVALAAAAPAAAGAQLANAVPLEAGLPASLALSVWHHLHDNEKGDDL